jgi:SAM-dependent methyltransferase
VTNPNALMTEYWNAAGGERWAANQARIDRSLRDIHQRVLAFAAPRAGESVLDVGCGCGTTSRDFGERGARVSGIDISEPMLAVARRVAPNAAFTHADASTHAFGPTHDLVFSRFGVMFFADPIAAFRNLRTALAPGGRLAFVCWRAYADNPWAAVPMEAARPLLPPQEPTDPLAPGPFAFASADRVREILDAAGWREVVIERSDSAMHLGDTIAEAVQDVFTIGPLSRLVADVGEDVRAQIRERVVAALAPYAKPTGIAPPAAVWLVGAR